MTYPLRSSLALLFITFFFVIHVDALTPPPLPSINTNNVFIVTNAVPDGVTTNTTAIQAAITSATAATGGGTVELPGPGTYLSGPLTMKNQVNLQVDSGATLEMLPQPSWPGSSTPFILGSSLHDVEISGTGTIDGQGAGWWGMGSRPNFIQFTSTKNILIENLTLQNPPTFHLMLKNNNSNITIQGININTSPTSPNTDGMDVGSTNMLIQNCHISDGDDNIELGGSSATAAYITITNCMFGHGHGVSVGSDLEAGVHDVTVINCTFTNTDNAIRLKSDDGKGGVVQNMFYYNIGMTNITYAPILIYSYYSSYGNPTTFGITPAVAEGTSVSTTSSTTPIWRNIIISNVTATASQPGMIWSRTELPATNIVLDKINITSTDTKGGNGSFALYNVNGVQILDSNVHVAGTNASFELFNAQAIFSNSVPAVGAITLTGIAVTNPLVFYNQSAILTNSTFFDATSLSLGGSTISDGTGLTLSSAIPVNFTLGTAPAQVAVIGNLTLNSTLNITNGVGFVAGTYPLFTYTGSFSGTPVLGVTPSINSYSYSLNTSTAGQVQLVVTQPAPPAPPVIGNIKVSGGNFIISGTGGVTNGTYYLLTSTNPALPLSQWTYVSTNSFDANANFTVTNGFGTNLQGFYLLQLQ
ncbi:MAG TPA: glycosyl hydrolase family 28 protein [Verrucomicrobiae bacterium]|jgi:polygalacturonase